MSPRAHNPSARWTTCEKCGHRGYHTRGDAKVVRKRHHGAKGMAVFACPHTEGLFHVGHRPSALSSGEIDRNVLRVQALRSATATKDFSLVSATSCSASASSSEGCAPHLCVSARRRHPMRKGNCGMNSADTEQHSRVHDSGPGQRVPACRQDDRSENTCGRSAPDAFTVLPGDEGSPVIIHVPHSSRLIPSAIRADLMLTDQELAGELDEATDTATDEIALAALTHVRVRPTIVINHLSRLVIDPERFPDGDRAEAFGRGPVYTRSCSGAPLRAEPYPLRAELIEAYFRPYADAVTAAVENRLNSCGRAVVIDLHSYPEKPSAFEDPAAPRPPLCIGTDPAHTPGWLTAAARGAFTSLGEIWENTPYSGTYVPLRYYGQDDRVSSVMIELRRDTYLADPAAPHPERITQLGRDLAALIDAVSDRVADV